MAIEDASYSTLENIRRKIRRITSSPSPNQLNDADIDHYINTFVLYGFPEDIKLFNLKKTFTFYTAKNVETYETNLTDPNDPLYNFANRYTFTGEPVYVNGVRVSFLQDRTQFYSVYPFPLMSYTIGSGDGVTAAFTGTLPDTPFYRNNVVISSIDNNGNSLQVYDDGEGNLYGDVGFPGSINYTTGVYSLSFTLSPGSGQNVRAKVCPYIPSRPRMLLFFDKKFTLRPVPDDDYPVNM